MMFGGTLTPILDECREECCTAGLREAVLPTLLALLLFTLLALPLEPAAPEDPELLLLLLPRLGREPLLAT